MFTPKNFAIGFLMALATGFSAWSIMISPSHHSINESDPKQIDSYMENVQATTFNKMGQPSLKLTSPKMVHYPENNTTYLTTPKLVVFRQSPEPWYVNADYARATNGLDKILLWSHVNIHHLADTENPTTSLLTETMTIFPNEQIALTDAPVTFTQPDTTIHAVGMQANLDAGTIKLLSQTQGVYDPVS